MRCTCTDLTFNQTSDTTDQVKVELPSILALYFKGIRPTKMFPSTLSREQRFQVLLFLRCTCTDSSCPTANFESETVPKGWSFHTWHLSAVPISLLRSPKRHRARRTNHDEIALGTGAFSCAHIPPGVRWTLILEFCFCVQHEMQCRIYMTVEGSGPSLRLQTGDL